MKIVDEDTEQLELFHSGGGYQNKPGTWENWIEMSTKAEYLGAQILWPSNSTLGIYVAEMKTCMHLMIYARMFLRAA